MGKILILICVIGFIFCLEKGLEMKKIILGVIGLMVFVCCLLVVVISGGFAKVNKENIEEIYRDYWNYSLGDYKFTRKVASDADDTGTGFASVKWYEYTFTFRDINNNSRNITVSNSTNYFNNSISRAVSSFLEDYIEKKFKSRNTLKIDGINEWEVSCIISRIDKNIDFYDLEKGIKFNELSLATLNKNNINVEIRLDIRIDGKINNYPDLEQKLIDNFKFMFENYEYSNIEFNFELYSYEDPCRKYYDVFYDGFSYTYQMDYGKNCEM